MKLTGSARRRRPAYDGAIAVPTGAVDVGGRTRATATAAAGESEDDGANYDAERHAAMTFDATAAACCSAVEAYADYSSFTGAETGKSWAALTASASDGGTDGHASTGTHPPSRASKKATAVPLLRTRRRRRKVASGGGMGVPRIVAAHVRRFARRARVAAMECCPCPALPSWGRHGASSYSLSNIGTEAGGGRHPHRRRRSRRGALAVALAVVGLVVFLVALYRRGDGGAAAAAGGEEAGENRRHYHHHARWKGAGGNGGRSGPVDAPKKTLGGTRVQERQAGRTNSNRGVHKPPRCPPTRGRRQPEEGAVPVLIPLFDGMGGARGGGNQRGRTKLPDFGDLVHEPDYIGEPSDDDEEKNEEEEEEESNSGEEDGDGNKKISADYGGLKLDFLEEGEKRNIKRDETANHGHVYDSDDFENDNDDYVDPYYAFDDDVVRHPVCRRTNWHRLLKPTCNDFHSLEMLERPQNKYISHGYYRDVFALKDGAGEDAVLKALRLKKKSMQVGRNAFETTRMDALVMERLSASPLVVDIYGHCGVSVLTESLPGNVAKIVEPTRGFTTEEEVEEKFGPRNDLSPTEKLTLALEIAEALAELHGHDGGVIVHDDVQLQQFLRAKDGTLKVNDFNRAEVMLWDEAKGEYCRYKNGGGYGNFRAPEEWADDYLNEKIDVYSYGNIVYNLLTGLEPFYTIEDDEVVHKKMGERETPFIDERYRTKRSFAEAKLTELLDMVWRFEPDERISIFEAVEFLRSACEENAKLVKKKPRRKFGKKAK